MEQQSTNRSSAHQTVAYQTAGGVHVTRTTTHSDPAGLDDLLAERAAAVQARRGGVLSSGMEYPGRYDRWHLAYTDPCIEVVARGRRITAQALNDRGRVLLPVVAAALRDAGGPVGAPTSDCTDVLIPEADTHFAEEDRSKAPTVFTALRGIIAALAPAGGEPEPHLGLYGAFGYDLAFQFEPIRQRHDRPDGPGTQRDLVLHLPDEILVVDRKRETCLTYRYDFTVDGRSTTGLPRDAVPTPTPTDLPELPAPPRPGAYADVVRDAHDRFAQGDLFEVVPSHTVYGRCQSPAEFFERLRHRNPAPFEFLLNLGEGEYLVGASPEMYVRVTGDRVETCPIAGTTARGADPFEDAERIRELLVSTKEESELTMCTDVDRNDKSRICVPGSVRVIGRRQIEMYSRLIHTVDHVEGRLRPGYDALDAFLTHMWAVTVTGAPKTWAMQFIEDHETEPRRWYGGAVGFVGFDGSLNTGLTLRTAHIRDGIAAVRVGATLLHDSDPDAEERETHLKARALLETLIAPQAGDAAAPQVTDRAGEGLRVLVVDHQDSFVNTLADYFRQHGADVTTRRYGFAPSLLDEVAPDLVVLSPGPGRPSDFDTAGLLAALDARRLPAFGVCLGLQAMVEHAGGALSLLPQPAHGKPGAMTSSDSRLLGGLPERFTAGRYHSLYATPDQVKGGFTVTATLDDPTGGQLAMAIEDHHAARWAVQFHPESILSAAGGTGHRIIANVLTLTREHTGLRRTG